MRNQKVPKTYYIASHNPEKCVSLLNEYDIKVDANDATSIAKGLSYLAKNGNEKDVSKIIACHPDREMILADAEKFGGYNNEVHTSPILPISPQPTEKKNSNLSAEGNNSQPNTNSVHLISQNMAYGMIGVGLTLAVIFTTAFLIKNIKSS